MKPRRQRKIVNLIEDDDLSRLKSYFKKHKINVNAVIDDKDTTPLHLSCSLGHDAIVDKSVDIVSPDGVTPREVIQSLNIPRSREDEDMSGDKHDSEEDTQWNDRLQEEMQDEYDEIFGSYDNDHLYDNKRPDTYDAWADKMSNDYHQKNYASDYNSQRKANKRKSQEKCEGESNKKPKISDEKKKEFQRLLHEEYKNGIKQTKDKLELSKKKRRDLYEKNCAKVFSPDCSKRLRFTDIPWPHEESLSKETLEDFLFFDKVKGSQDYKKALRIQQIRWHPDRFQQKCGAYIVKKDRTKVAEKVKEISQHLNSINCDPS